LCDAARNAAMHTLSRAGPVRAGHNLARGRLDEAAASERWLQRTERALQTDTGPDIRLLVHIVSGMLQGGRGSHREALMSSALPDTWDRS
jgi:hypothetical protein